MYYVVRFKVAKIFTHDNLQIIPLNIQRKMFVNVSLVTENVCVHDEKELQHMRQILAMQKRYSPTYIV